MGFITFYCVETLYTCAYTSQARQHDGQNHTILSWDTPDAPCEGSGFGKEQSLSKVDCTTKLVQPNSSSSYDIPWPRGWRHLINVTNDSPFTYLGKQFESFSSNLIWFIIVRWRQSKIRMNGSPVGRAFTLVCPSEPMPYLFRSVSSSLVPKYTPHFQLSSLCIDAIQISVITLLTSSVNIIQSSLSASKLLTLNPQTPIEHPVAVTVIYSWSY